MEHPIILLSRVLPENYEKITDELLDKVHLALLATDVHKSPNREEVSLILTKAFVETELASIVRESNPKQVKIKRGNFANKVIKYYGK